MATRSTSIAGRPALGRPAAACSSFLMILILGVAGGLAPAPAPARADGAPNASVTIQLLWQMQQGCAVRCAGTSQTQAAVQTATVVQVTAAGAGAAAGPAVNAGAVIQLIVQTQLGCVAFCVGTTRTQSATQRVDVTQLADAIAGAAAANAATVSQLVWQYQDACAEACDDVSATQVADQAAALVQAAESGSDPGAIPAGPPLPPELQSFLVWLTSVAGAAVVDVVEDHDVAACLADCTGDVQVQIDVQEARVAQVRVPETPTAAGKAPVVSSVSGASGASATTRTVAVTPRAAKAKRRVARRPGHRGRRNATRHRRPATGGGIRRAR